MTLPARISPAAGQALDSYLEHVAEANDLTAADLTSLIRRSSAIPSATSRFTRTPPRCWRSQNSPEPPPCSWQR